ncbi:ABC-2 transporter permease [Oribacterium sinus]|uniref:ABC-2 transporter permease n=1 Tax=Oribacterium sinus TaxID=237576 RepID=UPI0028EA8658|nr:ABC transporter permease [Oribacterium sinus]
MRGILGFIKRNVLLFFKDWQSILFSLLTSIIVLVLYLLFLKGTFVSAIQSAMEQYPGLASMVPQKNIDMFANLFLLSGILGSAMISVPFSCITVLVKDRANKVDYDILATPMKREQIIFAYFVSAVLTSTLLTDIILAVGLIGIRMQGNMYLNASQITIMLRNILLNGLLEHINTSLQGVDQGMFVLSLKDYFSFKAKLFYGYLNMNKMLGYILGVILFCIVAQIMIYSGSYKKN